MKAFTYIEKWITEHGSAAALREHVALLKTQMGILEKENSVLKKENFELKIQVRDLESENNYLKQCAKTAKQPFPKPGLIHDFDRRKRRSV